MCPGNTESGGRRLSGRTRHGNPWLRRTLAEIANVAGRTKGAYLAAQFRRIAARRGKGRAIVAVGHSVLVAIYYMLTRHEPYCELGAFTAWNASALPSLSRLSRRPPDDFQEGME
jgi:transposase